MWSQPGHFDHPEPPGRRPTVGGVGKGWQEGYREGYQFCIKTVVAPIVKEGGRIGPYVEGEPVEDAERADWGVDQVDEVIDEDPLPAVPDGEAPMETERIGFDDEGRYELGALPLLVATPALIAWWRQMQARRRARRAQRAAQPQPAGGRGFALFRRPQQPQQTAGNGWGGTVTHPRPRARCKLVRVGGRMMAVDEYGNEAEVVEEILGGQAMADEILGDDGDDWDEDDDEDEDDEMMGAADEEVDDMMWGAVDPEISDDEFGGKEERVTRRIERLEDRIDKTKEKPLRQTFRKMKARKRKKRIRRIQGKIKKLRGKIREGRKLRAGVVAAAAVGVGAGAALGVAGSTLASRGGANLRATPSILSDPVKAHALRVAQTKAGLRMDALAPAGSGRLVPLEMYVDIATPNPRNALTVPAAGITVVTSIRTEDLPYAYVKMVGFTSSTFGTDTTNNAIGLVSNLRIRGGTNLFLHEGPGNANNYNTDHTKLVGLRSYPNIRSPNFAQVDIQAAGDLDDVVILSTQVIVDVLEDDVYGTGDPGAYA